MNEGEYWDYPEDMRERLDGAIRAIWERDLQPLADYLRSDMPIDKLARSAIADAIEGRHYSLQIRVCSTRRGRPKSPARASATYTRNYRLAQFVDDYIARYGAGTHDSALKAAMELPDFKFRGKDATRRAEEALAAGRAFRSLEPDEIGDMGGAKIISIDGVLHIIADFPAV